MAQHEDGVWEPSSPRGIRDPPSSHGSTDPAVVVLHSIGNHAKSWELPDHPGPQSISVLNDWSQGCLPQAVVTWEYTLGNRASKDNQCEASFAEGRKLCPPDQEVEENFKGKLNMSLNNILGRPVAPGDVLYSSRKQDDLFVANVTITAAGLDEISKEGDPKASKKSAEHSAAEKAWRELQCPQPAFNPDENFKGKLISVVQLLLRRSTAPGEIVYSTEKHDNGFVANVSVTAAVRGEIQATALPFHFFGDPQGNKKRAEQSAAEKAYNDLQHVKLADTVPVVTPSIPVATPARLVHCAKDASQKPNCKGELNELFIRALGRPVVAGELRYSGRPKPPEFVAVLDATSVLEVLDATATVARVFEGAQCSSVKEAEQSAAAVALQDLRDFLTNLAATIPKPAPFPPWLARDVCSVNKVSCCSSGCIGQFLCKVKVAWNSQSFEVCTPVSFPSKHLAKEHAAWLAVYKLHDEFVPDHNDSSRFGKKPTKQDCTMTRKEKTALSPCWHGDLREICHEAGLHCACVRQQKGWTQQQLAARLRPSQRVDIIKRLESHGEMPDGPIINAINCALGSPLPRAPQKCENDLSESVSDARKRPTLPTVQEFVVASKAQVNIKCPIVSKSESNKIYVEV